MDQSVQQCLERTVVNCRYIGDFQKLNMIGQGTYGVVFYAKDRESNNFVAIKKMKVLDQQQGFPITSLRQIKILKTLSNHPNIVHLKQVVVGAKKQSVFLVFEFCQLDLAKLFDQMSIDKASFTQSENKCLFLQLAKGMQYAHSKYIIHRDLKMTNILINSEGIIKIADFGLARQFEKPQKPITSKVVTLWYRAPELLFKCKVYSTKVDVWSLGCILGQFLKGGNPILKGSNENHQFKLICQLIGYPTKQQWPQFFTQTKKDLLKEVQKYSLFRKNNMKTQFKGFSDACIDLLNRMLCWNPQKRISLDEVLYHSYFFQSPKACFPDQLKVLSKLSFYGSRSNAQLAKKRKKV